MDETGAGPAESGDENEIDEGKLKGDAIGDTMYSEKWVIQTLMEMTKELPKYSAEADPDAEVLELDPDLESNLCLLWDMTADNDVAQCLFRYDVISLAKCVIETSRAPRLTEIAIGVLANICCSIEIANSVSQERELLDLVIEALFSDDIPTIVQCVRLLDTLLQSPHESFVDVLKTSDKILLHVCFILKNSLNKDLLCSTAKIFDQLISHFDLGEDTPPIDNSPRFPVEEMLTGVLECMSQLRQEDGEDQPRNVQSAFDALISALYNLSRLDRMRREMVNQRDRVVQQLWPCMEDLGRRYDNGDELEEAISLMTSSVEAITLWYVVSDTSRCRQMLEWASKVAAGMSDCCRRATGPPPVTQLVNQHKYASDFDDMVCDCLRRMHRQMDVETVLSDVLEPLSAAHLTYVLRTAQKGAPDVLQQLVMAAKDSNSHSKIVDTLVQLSSNQRP